MELASMMLFGLSLYCTLIACCALLLVISGIWFAICGGTKESVDQEERCLHKPRRILNIVSKIMFYMTCAVLTILMLCLVLTV